MLLRSPNPLSAGHAGICAPDRPLSDIRVPGPQFRNPFFNFRITVPSSRCQISSSGAYRVLGILSSRPRHGGSGISVQGLLAAIVFISPVISLGGGIPEAEGPGSRCQDKLIHITLSFSHPEGTSSPEQRGHSDADATKPQLDALPSVLVEPELGERRPRPLPVTFCPTSRISEPLLAAILGVGGSLFCRHYAKGGCFVPFRRRRSDPEPNSLPVCARTAEGLGPHRKF